MILAYLVDGVINTWAIYEVGRRIQIWTEVRALRKELNEQEA